MQEQAAPPRFRGNYPSEVFIPNEAVPLDPFVRRLFDEQCISGDIRQDGNGWRGYPRKLILKILDPEIKQLAGDDQALFDSIDCQDIKCTCSDRPGFMQLFSYTTPDRDSIIYNNCKRCIFAAAKRQMKSAPTPDANVAREFVQWAKKKIDQLIGDDLADFGYSFNQWYNHLTRSKQKRMDAVHEYLFGNDNTKDHFSSVEEMDPRLLRYEAICKAEIQSLDGKPRMVCSIPDLVKYVMGPVCWRLEELFAQKIPTYCGGLNLQQMEDKINHYIDLGFTVVAEGDGSAFDNTQDVLLKEIDRYIYSLISERIHHVPQELFRHVSQAVYKVMDVITNQDKVRNTIMRYAVLGTVFSGDCDTTLMNTLRMGFYNWFTNEQAGLNLDEHFVCFSKGDDFTVMYNYLVDVEQVKSAYSRYWLAKPKASGPIYDGCDERYFGIGQILKFIEFGPPNTIKFCSLRAWYTNPHTQHICLTRDPGKFTTLSKYSRKALHLGSSGLGEYCYDQALALRTAYGGIHYFDDMANMYQKAGAYYMAGGDVVTGHRRAHIDKRITLPLEVSEQYDGFSYEPRSIDIKIEGSYWETWKKYLEGQPNRLSPVELDYVNQQIDEEFADRPIWLLDAGRPL
jgi:hypothetical protein